MVSNEMRRLSLALLAFIACACLFQSVSARGTFTIAPSEEAVDTVESKMMVRMCGNLSVVKGYVDFCLTSPSGEVLFLYNKTGYVDFDVNTTECGVYTFHIVNSWSSRNVTATLCYYGSYEFTVAENLHVSDELTTFTSMTSTTTSPVNPLIGLIEFLKLLVSSAVSVVSGVLIKVLGDLLGDWLRKKRQEWKDGESKTPVSPLENRL